MKVIMINGSPRKEGNTNLMLKTIAGRLEQNGIESEIIHIGNKNIHGCIACGKCAENKDEKCAIHDDLNECIQKMKAADGIILGTPVYYSGIAGTMKCFCDRAFYVAGANGALFRHKIGAAAVALRRSGGVATFDQLNHYFTICEMPVVSANYWNVVHGRAAGEAAQDGEGLQIVQVLADNMAWLIKATAKTEKPAKVQKVMTNFIR